MRSSTIRFGLAVLGLALMSLVQARADEINYTLGSYSAGNLANNGYPSIASPSGFDILAITGETGAGISPWTITIPVAFTSGYSSYGEYGPIAYSTAGWTLMVNASTKSIDLPYTVSSGYTQDILTFGTSTPIYFYLGGGKFLEFTVTGQPISAYLDTVTGSLTGTFQTVQMAPEPASVGMMATAVVAFAGCAVRRRWRRA